MITDYNAALSRLAALSGTDEGFYVLALHSFIEGFSNKIQEGYSAFSNFPDVIELLMDYLKTNNTLTEPFRKSLSRLAKEHNLVNRVRHQFQSISKDEAQASTANFLVFCEAFGIVDPALSILRDSVQLFGKGITGIQLVRELDRVRKMLAEKEHNEAILLQKATKYDEMEVSLTEITSRESKLKAELVRSRQAFEVKDQKSDQLRKALFDLEQEKNSILEKLKSYRDVGEYLQFLERFSSFTRTRLDYERSVMQLTQEQEAAARMVRETGDYIIKGGAGTGKTLVLLHALERYIEKNQTVPGQDAAKEILLLTYTNTLVKYSRYLAYVVGRDEGQVRISTADSQILSALKVAIPGGWIDFKAPHAMIKDHNTTSFLSDEELAIEIEDVIWGNLVTRTEYLEKHILRKGMKQPLNARQRELVWSIQENVKEYLVAEKRYSPNLACVTILNHQDNDPDFKRTVSHSRIFIDEGQDLSTATIRCLKAMSPGGIVLAADDGQTIYKIGSQYLRAGLASVGHVRILHTNFRNTRQIHDFAEAYLLAGGNDKDEERAHAGLREGPWPELITKSTENELVGAVIDYARLFTGRLGYDLENIGILGPTRKMLDTLKSCLSRSGFNSAVIKDDTFNFKTPGVIRLSTLHSSKGVEFPVVLLFLPCLGETGNFDDKTVTAMQHHLVYVALTRAMDHVVLFTLENPEEKALQNLQAHARSCRT